ncbi:MULTISPECIES: hypothetical protein [Streptomyces]|uniref:Uncharacterized protein n=1 Tax=Streptomyces griseoruber TaxID=1943 RepID=A0A101SK51_9ACTN|nr:MULTISPECIES: hypothetical protein [Streptomyces]KUN75396.1 hypothetical protein AQJ64_42760 [Streptomyces griseoruber]NUV61962.1 hypothetical protein [Streptomyces sp. CAI-85]
MQEEFDDIKTWDDLRKAADVNGGVYLTNMGVLREVKKAGRLGNLVREEIGNKLSSIGLGHLPDELPAYQERSVILYVKGGPVGKVVQAVIDTPSHESADQLRQLNTSEAQDKLRRIAEIVQE